MTGASGHRAKGSRQIQRADPRHDTPDTGVQSATVDPRAKAIHRGMARLLRSLPDPPSPHEPRSVDPSKIAFVSLAAMANQAKPLRGVTPSRRSKVPGSGRSWFTNRALAHVRTSGGPTSPAQRLFRVARTSPNLCARPSLTRSNRRGTLILAGAACLDSSLRIGATGSHVPYKSLTQSHAAFMPDAAWAAIRPSPRLIPG